MCRTLSSEIFTPLPNTLVVIKMFYSKRFSLRGIRRWGHLGDHRHRCGWLRTLSPLLRAAALNLTPHDEIHSFRLSLCSNVPDISTSIYIRFISYK